MKSERRSTNTPESPPTTTATQPPYHQPTRQTHHQTHQHHQPHHHQTNHAPPHRTHAHPHIPQTGRPRTIIQRTSFTIQNPSQTRRPSRAPTYARESPSRNAYPRAPPNTSSKPEPEPFDNFSPPSRTRRSTPTAPDTNSASDDSDSSSGQSSASLSRRRHRQPDRPRPARTPAAKSSEPIVIPPRGAEPVVPPDWSASLRNRKAKALRLAAQAARTRAPIPRLVHPPSSSDSLDSD